jgi:2-keto-4-pentenoate hydratase
MDRISKMATEIHHSHRERRLLNADVQESLDLSEAYAVQQALTALRISEGAAIMGWKLGYTSEAMRRQMHVEQPNFGPLLDSMLITDGSVPDSFVHPRVEPEIAVVVGPDLQVVQALAALEVVDSVWQGYRFSVELNTADGSSAAGVVLGTALPLTAMDELAVTFTRNGALVGQATGAAAMGHPLRAVDWLVESLAAVGDRLRPGQVIITGGLTAAVPITSGDVVEATFGSTERVCLRGPSR